MLTNEKSIIACSTGLSSNSAIGIIRLSGSFSLSEINHYFSIDIESIKPRFATQSKLLEGEKILDDLLVLFFKGPNSYSGENLLELHCHGNLLNIQRIIDLFLKSKIFVLAKPGEFSYRALKNKKLSFSQIEGLDSFLNAKSSLLLDEGLSLLNGELKKEYEKLSNLFLDFKSSIDLLTDFSEDVGDDQAMTNLKNKFSKFYRLIKTLDYRASINVDFLSQAKITIFGQTNAGKSSLFNNILGRNRAIVSTIAGTTRDYISEYVNFNDLYFELTDTAGIRLSDDYIESMGIELAKELLEKSFYKILVININDPFELFENESKFWIEYDLLVITHIDTFDIKNIHNISYLNNIKYKKIIFLNLFERDGSMGANKNSGSIEAIIKSGSIEPQDTLNSISELSSLICEKYNKIALKSPIINKRHRQIINQLNILSLEFSDALNQEDIGILSFYCQKFSYEISELIGIIDADSSVNNIFDNFCIGK